MSKIDIYIPNKINFSNTQGVVFSMIGEFEEFDAEAMFQQQMDDITENILLDAPTNLSFDIIESVKVKDDVKWTLEEVVAGSSISNIFNAKIATSDVDVYFKTIESANLFAKLNKVEQQVAWNLVKQKDQLKMCAWVTLNNRKYNLIWGYKYKNIEDLISRFDIRACAMAYDPCWNKITLVQGALHDALDKRIVWQTTARNISVHRLIKYSKKGFTIDKYQKVIFAELLKEKFNMELELNTGYGETI